MNKELELLLVICSINFLCGFNGALEKTVFWKREILIVFHGSKPDWKL
jgi:hypothetical protein